jgi:hypothetical protein
MQSNVHMTDVISSQNLFLEHFIGPQYGTQWQM